MPAPRGMILRARGMHAAQMSKDSGRDPQMVRGPAGL